MTTSKGQSLRAQTANGVVAVGMQAVATRVLTLGQQLALAWLLAKSDFGVIGLAYTATTFVALLANPGIDTILVQRHKRFNSWASPAFSFGLTTGVLGGLVMLVAGPFVAMIYHEPQLPRLMAILALSAPIQALQIVPNAKLRFDMRFNVIAALGILQVGLTAVLTVLAAYLGFGVYSFVIPVPICAVIVSAATWWVSPLSVRFRPEFRRWKHLLGSSSTLLAIQALCVFDNQADYMALGLAGLGSAAVGAYVFGFNVAVQPIRLLAASVPTALFPGLSHLVDEPSRQVHAGVRATRLLALVSAPVCVLQMLILGPLFRLLFPPVWNDAVLPCQILTAALMINSFAWPSHSLMLAQGRYRALLVVIGVGAAALSLALKIALSLRPSIVSVAVAVFVWHFVNTPYFYWSATRRYAPWHSYPAEAWRPIAAACGAALTALIVRRTSGPGHSEVFLLLTATVVFGFAYVSLIMLLAKDAVRDLLLQIQPTLGWLRRVATRATAAT